jgi:CRP-like cAMP-binding protein
MMRHRVNLSAFDGVSPFAGYDGRALAPLAPHVDRVAVMPGVALASEGCRAREVLFIAAGEVLVSRGGEPLAPLGPGAIIGAHEEASGTPHDATYVAGAGVAALALPAPAFRWALRSLKGFASDVGVGVAAG